MLQYLFVVFCCNILEFIPLTFECFVLLESYSRICLLSLFVYRFLPCVQCYLCLQRCVHPEQSSIHSVFVFKTVSDAIVLFVCLCIYVTETKAS